MIVTATIVLLVAQSVVGAAVNKRHEVVPIENTPCTQVNTTSSSIASYQASESNATARDTNSTSPSIQSSPSTGVTTVSSTIVPYGAVAHSSTFVPIPSSPTSGFYLAESSSIPQSSSFKISTSGNTPVCTSSCSSAAFSSTIILNSSIVPSTSRSGSPAETTAYFVSQLSASNSANSASTDVPQSSGNPLHRESSLSAQIGPSTSDLSIGSSAGCVLPTTVTVYVTAPEHTADAPTTVHVTSTQYVTEYDSAFSVIPLSSIIPLNPGSSTSIDAQSSSSVVFTIPESTMILSSNPSSGAPISVLSSSVALSIPSSTAGPTSLASVMQPTPSYYPGAPHSSFVQTNSTSNNPTSTVLSTSLTSLVSAGFSSTISSSSALLLSNAPIASVSGGYSMAASSTLATSSLSVGQNAITQSIASSSSTVVMSHSDPQPTSSQEVTETITRIPVQSSTAVVVVPTTLPAQSSTAVVVVPTTLPPNAVGNDAYEAAYKADKMYKRDATIVRAAVEKSASNSNPKLVSASKLSPKPSVSIPTGSINAPKPTSAPTSKVSSNLASGDRTSTKIASQDPRCPYPYPGIHCGKSTASVMTVSKPTATSKISDAKKTESVSWCPYPYPGGKGEACQ